ncbi:hypothetical protein IHO13_03300, partial [Wolbachia endosymbiont of Mansonella perstans]|nr:hypothetical protein [Wolbachia endosymbiont of Mansonella perstans]
RRFCVSLIIPDCYQKGYKLKIIPKENNLIVYAYSLLTSLKEGYYEYKHMEVGNTLPIIKMSVEGTVALASLAAAITMVLIATNIVALPESLVFISTIVNPIGIAALFIVAMYFATLAYCSYKQMGKNEEIGEAKTSAKNAKATKKVFGDNSEQN